MKFYNDGVEIVAGKAFTGRYGLTTSGRPVGGRAVTVEQVARRRRDARASLRGKLRSFAAYAGRMVATGKWKRPDMAAIEQAERLGSR